MLTTGQIFTTLIGIGIGISLFALYKRKDHHVALNVHEKALRKVSADFRITTQQMIKIIQYFQDQLKSGLEADGQQLKCLPSFVTRMPTGKENGTFLALDLGGTNLRVCEIVLEGSGKFRLRQKKFVITEKAKVGEAKGLFGFIARCTESFLSDYGIAQEDLRLGFTFSFPVQQVALNQGLLMNWNKGFAVNNTIGKDMVALLKEEFDARNLNIQIVAIVNDTVGTLVAHGYVDPNTIAGVILGTGTNAAYVEKVENIAKWKRQGNEEKMIVNIEWGNFDNEGVVLPVTDYDWMLDKATENPMQQRLEKMVSGLYMGEIVRLVLVELQQKGILFQGINLNASKLLTKGAFETQYMSRIERDHSAQLQDCKVVLEDILLLGADMTSNEDRACTKRVCECVGIRAARLSAACIAAVIKQTGGHKEMGGCTISIDGSVFEFYPHFKSRMKDALSEIFGTVAENFSLSLATDGSGVGAALIAAIMG